MSDALTMSVLDTLHDVTMDTIFDAVERFDALVRRLRGLMTDFESVTVTDMALWLRGSWGAHPRPIEAMIEPPRVYRRVFGSIVRLFFYHRSGLYRRSPLLRSA